MSVLQRTPVEHYGPPLKEARLAAILLHGRGADAADIISLAPELGVSGIAYVAPDAPGNTWYPHSFLAPIEVNEPHLTNALRTIDAIVSELVENGFDHQHIVLAGFSQGACLSLEYAALSARRWAAVLGFSGGLIGAEVDAARYEGDLKQSPVYLGCSDVDPHIPAERVRRTAELYEKLNAAVTIEFFPGRPHSVYPEEIEAARTILQSA